MFVPKVGSPGWKKEYQTSSSPSGKSWEITDEVAQEALANPILGKKALRVDEETPKDSSTKRVTSAAFRYFRSVNKANR